MACGLSKSLSLSSSLKRQGIVTILGGDFDCDIPSNTSAASLRRTFSADMSSKNWISQNGYCPMKRISSSEELCAPVADSFSPSNEEEGGGGQEEEARSGFDIWTQIQEEKNKNNNKNNNNSQIDVWSTILSQKTDLSKPLPPPYVHPLVKRSSSSLSEKSLEICTESLGSETGSDGFSLYPSSETGDSEEEKGKTEQKESLKVVEEKEEQSEAGEQETWTANYNSSSTICKKTSRGSFPPPIPSLSSEFGKSLQVRSHRNDGRLVIEAVSVPSQNNFCATRHDGRLVLTFAGNGINPKDETDGEERKSEVSLFEEEIEEETEEMEFEMEEEEQKAPDGLERGHGLAHKPNRLVSVHRLAHKSIGLPNRNPGWPTNGEVKNKSESVSVAHSLPPRPRVAQLARAVQPSSTVDDTVGAACFNGYDYYWRPTGPNINMEALGPNAKAQLQAQKLHHKKHGGGGGDAWLLGCKQQRRSLLFFEPFCIAT